jgi:hypothetical protein
MAHQHSATSGSESMVGMHGSMSSAINAALHCHATCVQTIQHCLQKGGGHAEASHISILTDCAQICVTSADFMLRESRLHAQVCGVCTDACEACAKSCETMNDDEMMQACIDACNRCAQECRQMAGMRS